MVDWKKEYRPCPVCGSESRKLLGSRGGKAHRDGLGEETKIAKCRSCTAFYGYPTLVPQSNPYEAEADYFHIHDHQEKIDNGSELIKQAETILGRSGSILEIGCGRGETLLAAKNRGWDVQGVEMTEQFAELASSLGVPVEVASAESCSALDNKYDVILLSAVLEHLYAPVDILRRIHSALVPGGLVFVDVPNEGSLGFVLGELYLKPRGWSMHLSPTFSPFHVVGFSPKSLSRALALADLNVHEMQLVKYTNVLPGGSVLRNLERLAMGTIQRIGVMIGKPDGIVAWARKA